jgi:hypothetical protein
VTESSRLIGTTNPLPIRRDGLAPFANGTNSLAKGSKEVVPFGVAAHSTESQLGKENVHPKAGSGVLQKLPPISSSIVSQRPQFQTLEDVLRSPPRTPKQKALSSGGVAEFLTSLSPLPSDWLMKTGTPTAQSRPTVDWKSSFLNKANRVPFDFSTWDDGTTIGPTKLTERHLEDLYRDHPHLKLVGIDEATLILAGQTLQLIVEEAAFDFLKRWCPVSSWPKMITPGEGNTGVRITVPASGIERLIDSVSFTEILKKCQDTLATKPVVKESKDLVKIADKGIMVCMILKAGKRQVALETAKAEIQWFVVGLECKALNLYKTASEKLKRLNYDSADRINNRMNKSLTQKERRDREAKELLILTEIRGAYEHHRADFGVKIIETLRDLMMNARSAVLS